MRTPHAPTHVVYVRRDRTTVPSAAGEQSGEDQREENSTSRSIYPALIIQSLDASFESKYLRFDGDNAITIGRRCNRKTEPSGTNPYIDSKLIGRKHAKVWYNTGSNKIYIKDLQSNNGTFVNGVRLSPQGIESEALELHTEDILEFGTDVIGEIDGRTAVVHPKVVTRVVCVLTSQDAEKEREWVEGVLKRCPPDEPPKELKDQAMYPALVIQSLDGRFETKYLLLKDGERITIGRPTDTTISPARDNPYISSLLVNRKHAQIWMTSGKIYIMDLKSVTWTLVNGERLKEAVPTELHTEDILEFGKDVTMEGEDGRKVVVQPKVVTRVACVFNEADVETVKEWL